MLIPSLDGGGAQRVIALLARGLSSQKYEVHLGLVTQNEILSPDFPSTIRIHPLGSTRVRNSVFALLRLVHTLKPHLIISGMAHLNFLVLMLRPLFPANTRVIVRQASNPSAKFASRRWTDNSRLLYRVFYPRADRIICQTRAMAMEIIRLTGVPDTRVRRLPNPVDVQAIPASQSPNPHPPNPHLWTGPGPHLLAVGRLSPEKGFDLLLHAFASLRVCFPGAKLTIAGEGGERRNLEAICDSLELRGSVCLPGNVADPSLYFSGATAFVLSSRHEGLPNALLEAASAGLPIVALPAGAGVTELLSGKPGIWLASEVSSRSLTRSLLLALRALRPNDRFAHSWTAQFAMDQAIPCYEDLIDETLANGVNPRSIKLARMP